MGAGLSSSLDKREKKRQEERNRKYIANDRVDPEEQKALSRKTEPVAPRTGTIDVDRGSPETLQMLATANEASVLERMKDGLTSPAQVEHMMEGGILNNAKGVNIEGSATLISARNNVTNVIYNTIVQPDVSEKDAKMLKNFVEWISDINYHAIQADNYRKRAEGTGTWAIEEPIIRQWFEGALGILWGIGMPGAGKTILASFIIEHLLQKAKANKRICVAFAFSRYTDQFTGEKLLGGLLRQVVEDHPSTLPFVQPMYDHHCLRRTRPSQKDLIDVLRAIFNSDLFDEKYCTLDGLDEALADTQVDVLDAFSYLPVNFLIMSRPLPLLKELVPEATFIEVFVHDADIEQLIEEKLRRMRTLRNLVEKDDWKQKVLNAVIEKSSGMFLLASLQLDMLGDCMHIKDLRSALDALPVGINTMYETTMERIERRQGSNTALRALTLLAHARESLKMDDLRHALAVDITAYKYDSDLLVDADTLLSVCCGLIAFEPETEVVRLVHYTARDFLKSYLSKTSVDAEAMLASTCVARLRDCGFDNYGGDSCQSDFDSLYRTHPFLQYAHRNWGAHAQSLESPPSFVEDFVRQCQRFPLRREYGAYKLDFLNSIHLAAAYNFHGMLAQWVGLNPLPNLRPLPLIPDVNSRSALERTALAFAAENGHSETVELLTRVEGVDLRCPDVHGLTPLIQASRQGHLRVVDLLLRVVEDPVNAAQGALKGAARGNHTEVMRSLLRVEGIDVNGKVYADGGSALTLAAREGRLDAVQLLLAVDGIDVNAANRWYGTALSQACRRGHTEIVKLLLQREDVDVNLRRQNDLTPLIRAAYWQHIDVVELLLQRKDLDVNATSGRLSALSFAKGSMNLEMVELLRRHGAQ